MKHQWGGHLVLLPERRDTTAFYWQPISLSTLRDTTPPQPISLSTLRDTTPPQPIRRDLMLHVQFRLFWKKSTILFSKHAPLTATSSIFSFKHSHKNVMPPEYLVALITEHAICQKKEQRLCFQTYFTLASCLTFFNQHLNRNIFVTIVTLLKK